VKPNRPPDTRHEPVYQGELTLETAYSRTKLFRAIITRDSNNRFRVRRQRWDARDNWIPDEHGMTIGASLDIARGLAEEKLKETPDGLSSSANQGDSV
jgi:hypothetical protein